MIFSKIKRIFKSIYSHFNNLIYFSEWEKDNFKECGIVPFGSAQKTAGGLIYNCPGIYPGDAEPSYFIGFSQIKTLYLAKACKERHINNPVAEAAGNYLNPIENNARVETLRYNIVHAYGIISFPCNPCNPCNP